MKASVYIATSLDSFIARANGDLDWRIGSNSPLSDNDYGYQAFMDTVDVVIMGRATFEKVLTFGAWPYSGKKVVVLSRRLSEVPSHLSQSVEPLALSPHDVVAHLVAQGARHAYVDGGKRFKAS